MASSPTSKTGTIALWSIALIALLTSVFTLTYILTGSKKDIVCVDALKLMSNYKGVEEARKGLQKRNEDWKARFDTLQMEYQASLEDYKSNKAKTTAKELKLMEQMLQVKQQKLVDYERVIKEQIRKQDEELASKILAKVNDFLKRYGKQKGYTIILAATQMGNVAYTNESFDVTDEVLAALNVEYDKMKK